MKRETTPSRVTGKITELCRGIVADADPIYLPVAPQEWSLPSECFPNVQRMIQEQGGKQINGWAIWQWANVLVEAEAHAVWEDPEGQLIDITPHVHGERTILFLRDNNMVYQGNTIANIRLALTSSPLVAEFIWLMNERDRIMCETPGGTCSIPKPMWDRMEEIRGMLHEEVHGNEFCPCQSGLKYKKCCGKED